MMMTARRARVTCACPPPAAAARNSRPKHSYYGTAVCIKMILLHGRILRGFPFGNDIMPARGRRPLTPLVLPYHHAIESH